MRRWLLIAAAGGPLPEQGAGSFVVFTSGDGDEPEDGDLHEALLELSVRDARAAGDPIHATQPPTREAHLIPIDDARVIDYTIEPRASVRSRGRQF